MAGKRDYMPKKDGNFFTFQLHLVNKVVTNKVAWGIPDPAVNVLTAHRTVYEPLYHKAQKKTGRTSTDVLAHRQKRKAYEKDIRAFVNAHIRFNDLMTASDRLSIGVPGRDPEPSPKPRIDDIPVVGLEPKGGGWIDVRCRTETDQTRDSMHLNADVIECRYVLFQSKGLPPNDPAKCPEVITSTKAHFIIKCGNENAGQRFYGFFRWANLTNPANSGSWSNALNVVIA
jgi:hypothetical protein